MAIVIPCGDFQLRKMLGRGAMAEVWLAEHAEREFEAAVKVVSTLDVNSPKDRSRFQREVAAQARLRHPGILPVFDTGRTGRETAETTDGRIGADRPFLVMELADRGTLRGLIPAPSWSVLHAILRQLLEALGHAHARGVIHRDLKPGNVLLFNAPDDQLRLKIADFGLAHAGPRRHQRGASRVVLPTGGTPEYMAPEQFRGSWRYFGPWTDLYSLGVLAYELSCGRYPYSANSITKLANAHSEPKSPEFDPIFPVPDAFDHWMKTILAAPPDMRFRCAADALAALPEAASDGDDELTLSADTVVSAVDTADDALGREADSLTLLDPVPHAGIGHIDAVEPRNPGGPPRFERTVPSDFPPPSSAAPPPTTHIGLEIFGLIEPQFADRSDERRRLWEAAADVHRRKSPNVVSIYGDDGVGKTRLARWLLRQLAETGTFLTIETTWEPDDALIDIVRRLLQRRLRTWNLSRKKVFEHLGRALEVHLGTVFPQEDFEEMRRGLTELLRPSPPDGAADERSYHFESPDDQFELVSRLLEHASWRRPIAILLDDALDNPTLIRGFRRLIGNRQLPLLCIVTGHEAPPDMTGLEAGWSTNWKTSQINLGSLDAAPHADMLGSLLDIGDELAERLHHQTDGNPLLGVQLLRECLQTDRLGRTNRGVEPLEALDDDIPVDFSELWRRRLQAVYDGADDDKADDVRHALEVAAALGRNVASDDWLELVDRLGLDVGEPLVEELVGRGLAHWRQNGWRFAHRSLIDALRHQSCRHARWSTTHHKLADWMIVRTEQLTKHRAIRIARHLETAGNNGEALEYIREAIARATNQHDARTLHRLLDRHDRLIEELPPFERAPHRLSNLRYRVTLDLLEGEPDRALENFREGEALARKTRHDDGLGDMLVAGALVMRHVGRPDESIACLEEARDCFRRAANDEGLARSRYEHGLSLSLHGDFARAARELNAAETLFSELDKPLQAHESKRWRATVCCFMRDFERAETLAQESLETARRFGAPLLEARSWNGLGEVARFRHEWQSAIDRYRRSIAIWSQHGDVSPVYPLNLCMAEIGAGHFREARQRLKRIRPNLERRGPDFALLKRQLCRLAIHAGLGEWSAWDRLFETCSERLDDFLADSAGEMDQPWLAALALDITRDAGDAERADRLAPVSEQLRDWFENRSDN